MNLIQCFKVRLALKEPMMVHIVKIVQQPHGIQWSSGQLVFPFQEVAFFSWISPKGTGWVHSWGAWKIEYAATVSHLLTRMSLLAGLSLLQLHFKLLIECCDWYRINTLSFSNSCTYACHLVRIGWPNTRRSSSLNDFLKCRRSQTIGQFQLTFYFVNLLT